MPYLDSDSSEIGENSESDQMKDMSQYTCFMEEISYPRYLGKSEPVADNERLSSCRIEIRPKSEGARSATKPTKPSGNNNRGKPNREGSKNGSR